MSDVLHAFNRDRKHITTLESEIVRLKEQLAAQPGPREAWAALSNEDAVESMGGAIHTALRKGTDAPEAHDLWKAISASDRAWSEALDWALWCFGEMDMALCKKTEGTRKVDVPENVWSILAVKQRPSNRWAISIFTDDDGPRLYVEDCDSYESALAAALAQDSE